MTRSSIRLIIILGTLSIAGILAVQIYWVKRAYSIEDERFRQSSVSALTEVANNISRIYELSAIENPVEKLEDDYYVVNLRTPLDAVVLEHYLRQCFKKHDLNTDFNYGIYDCDTDEIRFGGHVTANFETDSSDPVIMPKTDKFLNYFAVRFPSKEQFLFRHLDFWVISSIVIFLVTGFFVYAMFVILRQKRLSEVQRDFVNNMTHEFQTPISTIQVAADVLVQDKIVKQPERLKRYVQIIRQENNRLKNQVESVLTTASVSIGKLELDIEPQDLHLLIHEALEAIKAEMGENLSLDLNATGPEIYTDRTHLLSVIRNLVDNAIKYSESPAEVSVKTENTSRGLILQVKDRGIGIPKEHIGKIFHKFYRVPTGNVHNVKGFGLGLNYVHEIIKTLKWEIKVESEPEKGSTFSIYIPQKK